MKKKVILCAALVAALMVGSLVGALAGPHTAAAQAPNQLVFVGDSLTEGFYATQHSLDYVFQTARMTGYSINVQGQYGVTAVFTAQKMAQEAAAGTPVVPSSSARVVIELGTNDVQAILDGSETLADFATAYRQILSLVHHSALKALIYCLEPWQDDSNEYSDAAWIDNFIAGNCPGGHSMRLGDLFQDGNLKGPAGTATWAGPSDDFHPNNAGHLAIAQRLVALLQD